MLNGHLRLHGTGNVDAVCTQNLSKHILKLAGFRDIPAAKLLTAALPEQLNRIFLGEQKSAHAVQKLHQRIVLIRIVPQRQQHVDLFFPGSHTLPHHHFVLFRR